MQVFLIFSAVLLAGVHAQLSFVHYNDSTCTNAYFSIVTLQNVSVSDGYIQQFSCDKTGAPTVTYFNQGAKVDTQTGRLDCSPEGTGWSRRIFCGRVGISKANSIAVPMYVDQTCASANKYATMLIAPGTTYGWSSEGSSNNKVLNVLGNRATLEPGSCKQVFTDMTLPRKATESRFRPLQSSYFPGARSYAYASLNGVESCTDTSCSKFIDVATTSSASRAQTTMGFALAFVLMTIFYMVA